ncbi:MAG: aspartyl protease family protein [Bacteroidota bacterium]
MKLLYANSLFCRIPRLGLLLCLLLCGFLQSQAKTSGFTFAEPGVKSVRIPIEVQHNVVLIPLKINGSFEMTFILDTGVKTTILTETVLMAFLGLDTLQPVRLRGLGEGDFIEGLLAQNVSMRLPGVIGSGINMVVLPDDLISYSGLFGRSVHGIIGYEIFGQFIVEINYQHKYLILHDPFSYKPPRNKRRYETLPITIKRFKPYVTAKLDDGQGNMIERDWLIDTGASHSISLYDPNLPLPDPSIDAFLGMGLSGNVYGKIGRVASFELGKFEFEEIIAGYPNASALYMPEEELLTWYGNIGSEVISRFNVVFDYYSGRLILRKNASYQEPFYYNISGLEIMTKGVEYDDFVVSYVRPNSPAEKAGIKIDDEIVSLNGISVQGLGISDIYQSLRRRVGRRVNVRIRRGGELMKIRFAIETQI